MSLSITDPAFLFPGISLLFLAFTNRYLSLAGVVRSLTDSKNTTDRAARSAQVKNLTRRISLIKYMQALGIIAFIFCIASMAALLYQADEFGAWLFVTSLIFMSVSLLIALAEVLMSGESLRIELERFETDDQPEKY